MSAAEPAMQAIQVPPRPTRTISDEFRALQYIINRFQEQLNSPDGIIGLHPYGPVNVEQAKQSFAQACKRLRDALLGYRDTTLVSWSRLFATEGNNPNLATITNRTTAAAQELASMRQIADSLHEDVDKCRSFLLDAAADAISRSLTNQFDSSDGIGHTTMITERLKAISKRLGLAYYTDVQRREGEGEMTTVTLAGGILVIDVDIGSTIEQLNVKVSYVSDIEHDERINTLMLKRLKTGDIRGFEKLVQEMATLDRLTNARSPANFIHNTFAIISTLSEIQKQELSALDGDSSQLLRYGTGIALPHTRHIGPSTLYYIPAVSKAGLTTSEWSSLELNSLDGIADKSTGGAEAMQVDGQNSATDINSEFWIPYTLVAQVEPPLPACALTIRGIMTATATNTDDSALASSSTLASSDPNVKSFGGIQDSPRLLEDAPTLESLIRSSKLPKSESFSTVHKPFKTPILLSLEQPQIRAWTIERVPLNGPRDILSLVPLLRRQAAFNDLLASCIGDAIENNGDSCLSVTTSSAVVSAQTHANDPFRIDIVVRWAGDNAIMSSPSTMDVDQQHSQFSGGTSVKDNEEMVLGVVLR
ncbi:hypothetical protein GGI23_004308, partial [Coemansia sp. RSA 2559]